MFEISVLAGLFLIILILSYCFFRISRKIDGLSRQLTKHKNERQWILSLLPAGSLTLGSALLDKINDFLINNIFAKSKTIHDIIDPGKGGIMVALEMGIIPLFVLLVFDLFNKWPLH